MKKFTKSLAYIMVITVVLATCIPALATDFDNGSLI